MTVRWFRFNLRSLLAAMVLAALAMNWAVGRMRSQKSAIARIQAAGGEFRYDDAATRSLPVWAQDLLGEDWVASVARLELGSVGVMATRNLQRACQHHQSVHFEFDRYDSILEQLPYPLRLSSASVWGVSDIGLGRLASSPALEELFVAGSFTDANIPQLARRPLKKLTLASRQLTDQCLLDLESCASLKSLHIIGSEFSSERMRALEQALPSCKVLIDLPGRKVLPDIGGAITWPTGLVEVLILSAPSGVREPSREERSPCRDLMPARPTDLRPE